MPCYNDGLYIQEAIDSVHAQTYGNIELIIIDDGSDDKETLQILDSLSHPYISILHTQRLRPAGARNFGIEHASGKYIMPLDSDDKIEPGYIKKAVEVFESQENIGAVYCHANYFGERSGSWLLPDYSLNEMILDNVVFVTALFLKHDWESVGGFSINMKSGMEDYDFWLSILELDKEIVQLPDVMFHYRIKPVSRTSRFFESEESVQETYRQIYFNHPKFYNKYRDEYALILRKALIHKILVNKKLDKTYSILTKFDQHPVIKKILTKVLS